MKWILTTIKKNLKKTAVYTKKHAIAYTALGLMGEAGEVAERLKRIYRGEDGGKITKERTKELEKELGDILWYISQLSTELGLSLNNIAVKNLEKLQSRKKRGKLKGSGDNR